MNSFFITNDRPLARRCAWPCSTILALAALASPLAAQETTRPLPDASSAQTPPAAEPVEPAAAEPSPPAAPASPPPPPTPSLAPAGLSPTPSAQPCKPCEAREEGAPSEGAGMFLFGAAVLDVSALNDRLSANGYEHVTSVMTVIGGEGHAVFPSGLVLGGHGAAVIGPRGEGPANLQTEFGGGFGLLDLGYAFVHTPALLFTLSGGIGGYGLSLRIGDDQSARFDDVLANPKRGTTLSQGGFLVGLTAGIDGRIPLGKAERGRRGFFTIGARVGALYGPSLGNWGLPDGSDAKGGPNTGLTGGYAAIALGFGGGPAPEVASGRPQ